MGSSPTRGILSVIPVELDCAQKEATGRIELPTLGLQDQCSATEAGRPVSNFPYLEELEIDFSRIHNCDWGVSVRVENAESGPLPADGT